MPTTDRNGKLVRENIALLEQALTLIESVSDTQFMCSGAGPQLRHVLEFYECFLDGLSSGHIDYDQRRRDLSLERSRTVAESRISTIVVRLAANRELDRDSVVFVRMEDSAGVSAADAWLLSSTGRELQSLCSHSTHHFALIAALLKPFGVTLPADFGVALSTLRHRAAPQEAA